MCVCVCVCVCRIMLKGWLNKSEGLKNFKRE